MYRFFAAWLTSWSMAQYMKLAIVMSTIGRNPVIAAPTAAPTKPFSDNGTSRTRLSPNSSTKPEAVPNRLRRRSSPRMITRSSRAISSRCASWIACR
jgi:hypothetical protein